VRPTSWASLCQRGRDTSLTCTNREPPRQPVPFTTVRRHCAPPPAVPLHAALQSCSTPRSVQASGPIPLPPTSRAPGTEYCLGARLATTGPDKPHQSRSRITGRSRTADSSAASTAAGSAHHPAGRRPPARHHAHRRTGPGLTASGRG
jgi:hypothetical protein